MTTIAKLHNATATPDRVLDTSKRDLAICATAIAVLLGLQFSLIFTRAVNWDEFYYYAQVVDFSRGNLHAPLQTVHVHFFQWLLMLPGSTVDHIVAARIAMLGFEAATVACIALMARRFSDDVTALIAACCYLSAGYVMQHGMSFRVDPMLTACLMSALAILLLRPMRAVDVAAFAMLCGLAAMISVKAVLFAPCFAGAAWLRLAQAPNARAMLARIGCAVGLALTVFAALYLLHAHSLEPAGTAAPATGGSATTAQAQQIVSHSANDMFFIGIPPYAAMIRKSAMLAPFFTLAILAAPAAISLRIRSNPVKVALIGLWLPLLTLVFYRNTAAYYYAFMLAPLAVAVTPSLEWARRRFGALVVLACLSVIAIATFARDDRQVLENQRIVIGEIERIVPDGTRYFDHSGMMVTLAKANGFMTPWGLEQYRLQGDPAYRIAMESAPVPLFIDNDSEITGILDGTTNGRLLPQDEAAVRANYMHFWGPVWIAGQRLSAGESRQAEMLVPGRYRVSQGTLMFDGRPVDAGKTIDVERGQHMLANTGNMDAILAWDELDGKFPRPAPRGLLWIGY